MPLPPPANQKQLQRLVRAWLDSGPDLLKLFRTEPELEWLLRYGETRFYSVREAEGTWTDPQRCPDPIGLVFESGVFGHWM